MRLKPETLAKRHQHARERRYPPHTLAPEPQQTELPLVLPRCTCADCQRKECQDPLGR